VPMDGVQLETGVDALLGDDLNVAIVVLEREGDEEKSLDRAEELPHRGGEEGDPLGRPEAATAKEEPHRHHFASPNRRRYSVTPATPSGQNASRSIRPTASNSGTNSPRAASSG